MDVKTLKEQIVAEISAIKSAEDLKRVGTTLLGRKGVFTEYLQELKSVSQEQRRTFGQAINELKGWAEAKLKELEDLYGRQEQERRERKAWVDITMPGNKPLLGKLHPITLTFSEMERIFSSLGFEVAEGPNVELEYYNFHALNFPDEHPSRDAQDTFYITDDMLLRTHTSPVQVRYMEEHQPPLKIIATGRVFRNESIDPTHAAEFHQIEGLYVDTDVSLADLKRDVEIFVQQVFGSKTRVRFRPSFFPFTEPSAEVDMSCFVCQGRGCSVCGNTGWIEILGSGMVHPNVFRAVGYDPEKYSGFAFGIGVDRVAMLKYGIGDIRLFLGNDLRFLRQF